MLHSMANLHIIWNKVIMSINNIIIQYIVNDFTKKIYVLMNMLIVWLLWGFASKNIC